MRTLTDLEGAFDLLERHADTYANATDEHMTPVALVALPARPPRRRATSALLGAVAAVAAFTAGVAVLTSNSGSHSPGVGSGGGTPSEGPAPRTFDITLDRSVDMTLLETSASADGTELRFFSRTTEADIDVVADGPATQLTPGLETVEVNGHSAYYSNGAKPAFVQPPDNPATGAVPSPTPPDTRYAPIVVWKYSSSAWLQIVIQGTRPTRDDLLRVARAVRVGPQESLRSAVRVDPTPTGFRLAAIDSLYHEPGDNPPYDRAGNGWFTLLHYARAGGDPVVVEATSVDITANWHGGQSLTVGGRPAYWHSSRHQLDVDAGNGRFVDIRGGDSDSLTDLLSVARATEVTSHPETPSAWFDAKTDLP